MQTLSRELKTVISRRLEAARSREILTIVSALCAGEQTDGEAIGFVEARPRFDVYVGRDTVFDNSTELLWTRGNVGKERMTWHEAREACEKLDHGGYSDWRLPTIGELLTLVDYERHDPAIDADVFRCESAWYWTGTDAAPSPGDCAWVVDFYYGYALWNDRDIRVRPRRARRSVIGLLAFCDDASSASDR